jgi:8-oxo-dGTP diphosphatase
VKTRDRACCYITKGHNLLVFEHAKRYDDGCIGVHIIGGGVKENESLTNAVIRETFEESGLSLTNPVFLGTTERRGTFPVFGEMLEYRHYFWLEAPSDTPDAWDYSVKSGDGDNDFILKHRFVPIWEANLSFDLDEMLNELMKRLKILKDNK